MLFRSGPRLLRRGRTPAALAALVEGGQRFNGAAAVTPRKVRYREGKDRNRASLQWGRGCYAAEGATADTAPCSRPDSFNGAAAVTPRKEKPVKLELSRAVRFNGAAAVTPRKGMEAAAGGAMLTHASMGPRLLRRGRRSTRTMRRTTRSMRFNGAAAVTPRKAPPRRAAPRAPGRFNGAAAVTPRKAYPRSRSVPTNRWLQWGRGCYAAEGSGRTFAAASAG